MKTKSFTLLSGREDTFSWSIRTILVERGTFKTRGAFLIRNKNHQTEYNREFYKKYRKTETGQKNIKKARERYNRTGKRKESGKRYRATEKGKETNRKTALKYASSEKGKKKQKEYYEANREKELQTQRERRKRTNYKSDKKYYRSPKGKITSKKNEAKRKQHLGYVALNDWFSGSAGHHIDDEHVIFMDKRIHESFSGYDRDKHRELVMEWIRNNDYELYECIIENE